MTQYTHQKHPYRATCIQYTGDNTDEILSMFPNAELYIDCIHIRHERSMECLQVGDWVVRGENGSVKCYTDEVFHIKYERLEPSEAVEHHCSDHPDAPHGFDRNGSHNAGLYVCECESFEPPDIVGHARKVLKKLSKEMNRRGLGGAVLVDDAIREILKGRSK